MNLASNDYWDDDDSDPLGIITGVVLLVIILSVWAC